MDVDALKAEAILGKDAEEFIQSELGRYIVGRVDQEREEAVQKLTKTFSWRRDRIRELQNQIWRCDTFKSWLADMVIRGKAAIDLLEQDS
jgi:hypothetical protein